MAIDGLMAELERRGREECDTVRSEARAHADRVRAEARAGAETWLEARLAPFEATLKAEAAHALATARRDAAAELLAARRRVIDRVLTAAADHLARRGDDSAWHPHVAVHVEEALAAVGPVPARVACRPALEAAVRRAIADRAGVTVVTDDAMPPGIRVTSADGAVSVDNTLPARLDRARSRLAVDVLARVDGDA